MLHDEFPEEKRRLLSPQSLEGTPITLMLYVEMWIGHSRPGRCRLEGRRFRPATKFWGSALASCWIPLAIDGCLLRRRRICRRAIFSGVPCGARHRSDASRAWSRPISIDVSGLYRKYIQFGYNLE